MSRGQLLTSEDYVALFGNSCPACLSEKVRSTEQIQQDGPLCWQSCKCDDCGQEWDDHYELVGYYPLEVEDE